MCMSLDILWIVAQVLHVNLHGEVSTMSWGVGSQGTLVDEGRLSCEICGTEENEWRFGRQQTLQIFDLLHRFYLMRDSSSGSTGVCLSLSRFRGGQTAFPNTLDNESIINTLLSYPIDTIGNFSRLYFTIMFHISLPSR